MAVEYKQSQEDQAKVMPKGNGTLKLRKDDLGAVWHRIVWPRVNEAVNGAWTPYQ